LKVQLEDIWINKSNDTPILTYCRKLMKEGIDPETVLEVYRGEVLAIRAIVGKAAKLTIDQDTTRFVLYKPFSTPHPPRTEEF
jgi:hypothetical protein